jgi:autophagy-related protein 9
MASNILSRLLPSASEESTEPRRRPSIHDYDLEAGNEMAIDEENLEGNFEEQDLEQLLAEATASEAGTEAANFVPTEKEPRRSSTKAGSKRRPKWMSDSPNAALNDDDNDVPESLMLEGKKEPSRTRKYSDRRTSDNTRDDIPPPVPGPNTAAVRNQWEATRAQQPLYDNGAGRNYSMPSARVPGAGFMTADPKQRALWKWANVENLDTFLGSVYVYYQDHGVWSICLKRALSLA